MNNLNLIDHFPLVLSVMSLSLSVFTFGICLFVAKTMGKRFQRESLVGAINKKYCDIRQLHMENRCTISREQSTVFNLCCKDANDVFLESLRTSSMDTAKLKDANVGLDAIINRMLSLINSPHYHIIKNKK